MKKVWLLALMLPLLLTGCVLEDNKYEGYWDLAEKEGADRNDCYLVLDINGSSMEAYGMNEKGI
ncbi:hypothetical protein IC620_09515, partial [Hazenella sp. IB182357]